MGKTFFAFLFVGILLVGFWVSQDLKNRPPEKGNVKSESEFTDWKDFSVPGIFKVKFPSIPQQAQEVLVEPKSKEKRGYNMYVATDRNGNAFMLNVITLPKDHKSTNEESDLHSILGDMLESNANNRVKNSELKPFRDKKSLTFEIENNQITVRGQVFKDKERIFVLTTVSKNDLHDEKEFQFFVNSFELIKDNK